MNKHLRLRHVWFSQAAGTETGGGGGTGTSTGTGTTDAGNAGNNGGSGSAAGSGSGSGTTGTTGTDAGDEEKIPKSRVEQMIEDRLARDRRGRPSEDEITQLKADQARLAELEAEKGTDQEKAVSKATKDATDAVNATVHGVLRRQVVELEASKLGFLDTTDAVAQLIANGELDGIKVGNDYRINGDDVASLLKSVLEKKPYLAGKKEKEVVDPGTAGIGAGGGDGKDKPKATPGLDRTRQAYGNSTPASARR